MSTRRKNKTAHPLPASSRKGSKARRRVAVITGTRAEFGLLVPVMEAIKKHTSLDLLVVAAGAHFLKPARTIREVEAKYTIAARVPMQTQGKTGRDADAQALGRGVEGFARAFKTLKPDWVVVLGDRIEAFAAASAASIAGIAVCHIHGGDRAEGIADEAMRHAITKLSHLHCAATKLSAERILKMGEKPEHVHVTGSPAIDGLSKIKAMSDVEAKKLGDPRVVMLLHPSGFHSLSPVIPRNMPDMMASAFAGLPVPRGRGQVRFQSSRSSPNERTFAQFAYMAVTCLKDEPPLGACRNIGLTACGGVGPRGVFLHPNYDPGREQILEKWKTTSRYNGWPILDHLPRATFLSLLKRMAMQKRGLLIGNSSAGLIECAALGVPALNLGPRQAGRERGENVVDTDPTNTFEVVQRVREADALAGRVRPSVIYGDGRAGPRIAALLAKTDPHAPALLRKRNSY